MSVRQGALEIYRESLPVMMVSLVGGLFSGAVLGTEGMLQGFERFPGLLLLLPAFLGTRGNVYGALGARISSGLHQGLIAPAFEWDRRLVNAVTASFVNGIGISLFVALLSWTALQLLGRESASLAELFGIMLIAGVSTSVVLVFGLLALIFLGFRYGLDPDNMIGPIVTTLGDVFGVTFLYVAVAIVEVVL